MIIFHTNFDDAMDEIEYTINQAREMRAEITGRALNYEHEQIKEKMSERWMGNFDSEGSFYGQKWVNLAPLTQRERKRAGKNPTAPILNRYGGMRDLVQNLGDAGVANRQGVKWVMRDDGEGANFLGVEGISGSATGMGFPLTHHFGRPAPTLPNGKKARLPARPIWGEGENKELTSKDEDLVENHLDEWIDDVIQRYF